MTLQDKLKTMTLTEAQHNLLAGGFCPVCEVPMRGRFEPVKKGCHFFAPEIYATYRERGYELETGHKTNCELRGFRL